MADLPAPASGDWLTEPCDVGAPPPTPPQAAAPEAPNTTRVCDLLLHLETAAAFGFRLASLIVHDADGARGVVHCVLAGRAFVLSPNEARLTSRCIAFEDRRRVTGWLASLFETAACDAEALAIEAAR